MTGYYDIKKYYIFYSVFKQKQQSLISNYLTTTYLQIKH